MKAYHIMMGLIIFNLMLVFISMVPVHDAQGETQYGLYDLSGDKKVNETYDIDPDSMLGFADIVSHFLGKTFIGLLGGVIMGSVGSWITRVPADKAVGYSVFIGTYWGSVADASQIFINIGKAQMGVGYMLIIIFIAIVAFVFVGGFFELIFGVSFD